MTYISAPLWTLSDEELYTDRAHGRIKRWSRPTDLEPNTLTTLELLTLEDATPTPCKHCGAVVRPYGGKLRRFDLCERCYQNALYAIYDADRKPWRT